MAPGSPIWARVAEQVDAVHMTAAGANAFWRTPTAADPRRGPRLRALANLTSAGLGSPLDMWEAESTVWFRWRFTAAAPAGHVDVPLI